MTRIFIAILLVLWLIGSTPVARKGVSPALVTATFTTTNLLSRQPAPPVPVRARPFPYRRVHASNAGRMQDVMCVRIAPAWKVCKEHFSDLIFVLVKDERSVGTWSAEIIAGGGSEFDAITVDLDGDHKDELVVANCTGINTAGEVLWCFSIFPNYQERGFTPPLRFVTEQYAAAGTFMQTAGDPFCNLLLTEWQYGVYEPPPQDFKQTDYIGRWYRYKAGLLEPIAGRLFPVRRWSDAMIRVPRHRQTPYDWLTHPAAKTFAEEPLTRTEIVAQVSGEIVDVVKVTNRDDGSNPLVISLRLVTGETRVYRLFGNDLTDQPDEFCHVGDADTGILEYEPADLKAWLVGKQVRLVDYQSRYKAVRRVLWV